MIELLWDGTTLILNGFGYSITNLEKASESGVFIHLVSETNDFVYRVNAYETTINGVLQTSADMIINTLSA